VQEKEVLTTGEVARLCHVAPRTVSKWFDSGKLRGYRIPGSRDRRIPRRQLLSFMRAYGIPTEGLQDDRCRVLIVDPTPPEGLAEAMNASQRYQVKTAGNGFEAGLTARQFHPHAIVLDASEDLEEAVNICRNIKSDEALRNVKVIAVGIPASAGSNTFDHRLAKPYSLSELVKLIDALVSS